MKTYTYDGMKVTKKEFDEFTAEDALLDLLIKVNKAKTTYRKFQTTAINAENKTGFYLQDESIDCENTRDAGIDDYTLEFWEMMLSIGKNAFGNRCEENNINANDYGVSY